MEHYKKTNAMRILDTNNISYEILTYPVSEEHLDGIFASQQVGLPPEQVYKTLVTHQKQDIIVCLIPVDKTLDLKSLAKASKNKKLEMLPLKDITRVTGYQRGGCSPLGMKKEYPTFLHTKALEQENIAISGGMRGTQIYLHPKDLKELCSLVIGDFVQK